MNELRYLNRKQLVVYVITMLSMGFTIGIIILSAIASTQPQPL